LLNFGRLPRGVEVMQGDQAFLDMVPVPIFCVLPSARARNLAAPSRRGPVSWRRIQHRRHKQSARPNASSDEFVDDVLVGRVTPLRGIDAHVGEYHLRTAFVLLRSQMAATFSTRRLTFDSGKSSAVAESILASVASLRPSVVMLSALSTLDRLFVNASVRNAPPTPAGGRYCSSDIGQATMIACRLAKWRTR